MFLLQPEIIDDDQAAILLGKLKHFRTGRRRYASVRQVGNEDATKRGERLKAVEAAINARQAALAEGAENGPADEAPSEAA